VDTIRPSKATRSRAGNRSTLADRLPQGRRIGGARTKPARHRRRASWPVAACCGGHAGGYNPAQHLSHTRHLPVLGAVEDRSSLWLGAPTCSRTRPAARHPGRVDPGDPRAASPGDRKRLPVPLPVPGAIGVVHCSRPHPPRSSAKHGRFLHLQAGCTTGQAPGKGPHLRHAIGRSRPHRHDDLLRHAIVHVPAQLWATAAVFW